MAMPMELKVLIIVPCVFVFCTFLLFMRFKAQKKARKSRAKTAENIFVVISYVCLLIMSFSAVAQSCLWLKHRNSTDPTLIPGFNVTPADAIVMQKLNVLLDFMYCHILWAVKGAFLAIQYDMMRALPPWHKKIVYGASVFMVVGYLVTMLSIPLVCIGKFEEMWSITGARCAPWYKNSTLSVHYFFYIVSDLIILVLYIFIIRKLQIPGHQIGAFGFIFFLLFVVMAASTARFAILYRINTSVMPDLNDIFNQSICSLVEWMVSYAVVCLPSLRKHFREKVDSADGSLLKSFGITWGSETRSRNRSFAASRSNVAKSSTDRTESKTEFVVLEDRASSSRSHDDRV